MLLEPASALTDALLAGVAFVLAWRSRRRVAGQRAWRAAFAAAGLGAALGTVYHGWLTASPTLAGPTWALITVGVAVTVSLLLAGTVATVTDGQRARLWLGLRVAGLLAFGVVALSGHAGLGSLVITESLTMAAILALWGRAWHAGQPGAGWVIAAIASSAGAAGLRSLPITLHLGWVVTGTALYHLAQIPGLLLLYGGLLRIRYADGHCGAAPPRTAHVDHMLADRAVGDRLPVDQRAPSP